MTRTGKIARLPKDIREELNCRLQDGHSGPGLLHWLNNLPECLKVLEDEFESRPITKQNLSEWKQGGYEEWLELLMPYWDEQARRLREERAGKEGGKEGGGSRMEDGKARTGGMNSAPPVKAGQTKSDQVKPSQTAKLASSDDDAPGGQESRNEQEHPTDDEHPTSNGKNA